jgi:hypothetical protein
MAKINSSNATTVTLAQARRIMSRLCDLVAEIMPADTWLDIWENTTKVKHVRTSRARIRSGSQQDINRVMDIMEDYCKNMLPDGSWRICTKAHWEAPMQGSGMTPYKHNALMIWYKSHSSRK